MEPVYKFKISSEELEYKQGLKAALKELNCVLSYSAWGDFFWIESKVNEDEVRNLAAQIGTEFMESLPAVSELTNPSVSKSPSKLTFQQVVDMETMYLKNALNYELKSPHPWMGQKIPYQKPVKEPKTTWEIMLRTACGCTQITMSDVEPVNGSLVEIVLSNKLLLATMAKRKADLPVLDSTIKTRRFQYVGEWDYMDESTGENDNMQYPVFDEIV